MNVLSLFDGISCGQVALNRAEIKYDAYYASEIKEHAIKVTKYHYPETIHLGNVLNVNWFGLPKINLLLGGSPCKGISLMNQKQDGLNHPESRLFWEYVRIKEELNPDYFILENTHGNRQSIDTISKVMGVDPISINSRLVSAQNRPRYYWTNIPGVNQPKDQGLTSRTLHDIFKQHEQGPELAENRLRWLLSESGQNSIKKGYSKINPYPKYGCILASGHKKWNENYLFRNGKYYHLSQFELEWLQTLPAGYTDILEYKDAYDVIGDGWTVDVIAHILSFMK
jgi:site-specific DNA-cytosine methylase